MSNKIASDRSVRRNHIRDFITTMFIALLLFAIVILVVFFSYLAYPVEVNLYGSIIVGFSIIYGAYRLLIKLKD